MWKPLSDNGKPIVKWGRKATGQNILIAGLPKKEKGLWIGAPFLKEVSHVQ